MFFCVEDDGDEVLKAVWDTQLNLNEFKSEPHSDTEEPLDLGLPFSPLLCSGLSHQTGSYFRFLPPATGLASSSTTVLKNSRTTDFFELTTTANFGIASMPTPASFSTN